MKTCGFENQINQYLDGELSGAKLRAFEAHLQECPSCREEVEQFRGLLDGLHSLEDREVPPALRERLHAALSEEIAKGDGRVKRKLNPWALTAAAAALVVVLVGGTMLAGGGLGLMGNTASLDLTEPGAPDNYIAADLDKNQTGGAYDDKQSEGFGVQSAPTMAPAATEAAAPEKEMPQMGVTRSSNGQALEDKGAANYSESTKTKSDEGRKIIYTAYLVVETREYDKGMSTLKNLLAKCNGYQENFQETGVPDSGDSLQGRTAVVSIRMPIDQYGAAMDELQKMGNVLSKNESTEDVSRQYVDTEARNRELIKARETYFKLLEKADNTESIVAIQNEITRLTIEIEQATAQLKYWDDKVSYSTITIEIHELVTPKTVKPVDPDLNDRMGGALNSTLNNMKKSAENFAVQFVGFLPWLAIIVVVAAILAAILIPVGVKARRAAKLKEAAHKQKEE